MGRFGAVVVVLVLGCGGGQVVPDAGTPARDAFLGTWSGSYTSTTTFNGMSTPGQGSTSWTIERSSLSDDRVTWRTTACLFQAKATTDTSLVVDSVNCDTQTNDAGCSFTAHIENGTGTRSGTSLSVTLGGSAVVQCSGGGPQTGTYTLRFDGSKN